MPREIMTIPATRNRFAPVGNDTRKRRVAAYARVSSDHEEQLTSYDAQVDYYTNYIKGRDDWEFVGMYADEGVTGTSTKHREGFKRMIADALTGKIDLIITKSVSRFARNTVDSLTNIRKLKDNKVECYFEKENIWTFDDKGEMLITFMSSFAQEESRSISENCTWGHRKRFADGKVSVPFTYFLGYDKGCDGGLVVNPEQAKLVKRIFGMFLSGMTVNRIASVLNEEGVHTVREQSRWHHSTIKFILTNEKYKGDALLQKSYTADFLTKRRVVNNGEVQQYYVHENHEAIIDPATFDLVQTIIARKDKNSRTNSVSIFCGKIKCGSCGRWYGPKVWHSNDKYRKIVWQCNHKFDGEKCTSPTLNEEEIKATFLKAANRAIKKKSEIIETYRATLLPRLSTDELEKEKSELASEIETVASQIDKVIKENACVALDQAEYEDRYKGLVEKYGKTKGQLSKVDTLITERRARRAQIELFLKQLKTQDLLTEFREEDWHSMVDHMTAFSKDDIRVTFKDGTEI